MKTEMEAGLNYISFQVIEHLKGLALDPHITLLATAGRTIIELAKPGPIFLSSLSDQHLKPNRENVQRPF